MLCNDKSKNCAQFRISAGFWNKPNPFLLPFQNQKRKHKDLEKNDKEISSILHLFILAVSEKRLQDSTELQACT